MAISKRCATEYLPKSVEYIYALRCPITFDLFYVGKTQDLKTRLSGHISECNLTKGFFNKEKNNRVKWIISQGMKPIIQIIEYKEIRTRIDSLESAISEMYWINFYKSLLTTITNVRDSISYFEYTRYKERVKLGTPLLSYYKLGVDVNGKDIIDRKRLYKDGFVIKEELDLEKYADVPITTYDYCYND